MTSSGTMNLDYWRARWKSGEIGFHQAAPTEALVEAIDRIAPRAEDAKRVIVPLCGKTLDLVFLAARGHDVTGVEGVEQAHQDFFAENAIPHRVRSINPKVKAFESEKITTYACNFFDLDPKVTGKFAWAFDRASLVTFDAADQPQYVAHLCSFLEPNGRLIVVGFHYDPREMAGPPNSVSPERIAELFSFAQSRELIGDRDALNDRFRQKGLTWLREETWLIQL